MKKKGNIYSFFAVQVDVITHDDVMNKIIGWISFSILQNIILYSVSTSFFQLLINNIFINNWRASYDIFLKIL